MNQKIITTASILFAVVFIGIMAAIFTGVIDFGDDANNTMVAIKNSASTAELEPYNNKVVSGDTVVAAINKMTETRDGMKMSYYVYNKDNSSGIVNEQAYGQRLFNIAYDEWDPDSSGYIQKDNLEEATEYIRYTAEVGDGEFISPVSEYRSYWVINKNGVFMGIAFKQD